MKQLETKLRSTDNFNHDLVKLLEQLEREFQNLKTTRSNHLDISFSDRCDSFENMLSRAKAIV